MNTSFQVLLIEDNPADARLIKELLRDTGTEFALVCADTLTAGLKHLATAAPAPDAILLDLSLPDSRGFATFQKVNQSAPRIPVIMLTGLDDQPLAEQAMRAGAQDYLVKGRVDGDLLSRAIRYAIGRERAKLEVETSERRFRAIYDNSTAGINLCDIEGKILFANEAFQKLVAYPSEEIVGLNFDNSTTTPLGDTWKNHVAEIAQGKTNHFQMEKQYLTRDNRCVWVDVSTSVIRDSEGRSVNLVNVVRDITERKRLEEDRKHLLLREQKARAEAEMANQSKDQFLAILSHELRTPLTPILAAVDLLKQNATNASEDSRFFLDLISENAELEARLVDDLLDVASIQSGKLLIKPEVVDIHEVINKSLEVHRKDIFDKHLEIFQEQEAPTHHVWADPVRVKQVLWNLVGNAVKFSEEKGWLRLRTSNPSANTIRIEVRDNGIGLDPAGIDRLFTAFSSGDMNVCRRYGGLGLGLVICKSLVESHGGTITAASEGLGKGATFTVDLPLLEEARVEKPAPAQLQPPAPTNAQPTTSILLVEDNREIARILSFGLRKYHFRVHTAPDAQTALSMAQSNPFDLLIIDIGLPDISGWELLRQIKAHRDIKAIALTGFSSDEDKRKSLAAGFLNHVTKPIDLTRLRRVIDDALGR